MELYCTHKMVASLKQDRRSLGVRQGETVLLKRQRWSERNGISRTCHVKRSLDSLRSWNGCFVHEAGCRMRLSVRRWPRVRFSVRRRRICPGEEKRIVAPTATSERHAQAHFVRVLVVRVRLSVRHTAGRRMPIPVPPSSTSWQPNVPRGYNGPTAAEAQDKKGKMVVEGVVEEMRDRPRARSRRSAGSCAAAS